MSNRTVRADRVRANQLTDRENDQGELAPRPDVAHVVQAANPSINVTQTVTLIAMDATV